MGGMLGLVSGEDEVSSYIPISLSYYRRVTV